MKSILLNNNWSNDWKNNKNMTKKNTVRVGWDDYEVVVWDTVDELKTELWSCVCVLGCTKVNWKVVAVGVHFLTPTRASSLIENVQTELRRVGYKLWKNNLSLASFNNLVIGWGHSESWIILNWWWIAWDENLKAVEATLKAEAKIDRWLSYVRGKTGGKETTMWMVDLNEGEIYFWKNKDWEKWKKKIDVVSLTYAALNRALKWLWESF